MPKSPPPPKTTPGKSAPAASENKHAGKQGVSSGKKPTQLGIFPIAALGASAGGLDALETFFKAMPFDSGIAFVLITHLDPDHVSLLPELIQKCSQMKVHQACNGMKVAPNHIYILPPNKDMTIMHGALQLISITREQGVHLPIDIFMRSLVKDQGSNAIGIILSGTGTDGTLGIKMIKAESGMVMVQDEKSAKYDGMPKSAIATGVVDYILPPDEMPEQLIKYSRHTSTNSVAIAPLATDIKLNAVQRIFTLLRSQTGHDFSHYKKNTIYRRIERRMNIHQINNIEDYMHYLEDSEHEVGILFKELLIRVTSFFRDPDAFDALRNEHLPRMFEGKAENYSVRVWVAGCSSGEEAYSLAIILQEAREAMKANFSIQVFATDIDEDAINMARAGLYPASIIADVSAERLKRYFSKEDDGQYRVKKTLREMLVFASQDIIKDPPFTKIDLLSCRNLLIYLEPELQKKLLSAFHYSLKHRGLLFLGSSETIGHTSDLFVVQNKKWKIFQRSISRASAQTAFGFSATATHQKGDKSSMPAITTKAEETSALQMVEAILQQSNTPPCVIINEANNVVYIHGRTGRYLEPPEGKISINILDMARMGLKTVLSRAIRKVTKSRQEVIFRDLHIDYNDSQLILDLSVKPLLDQSLLRGLMMVMFEEKTTTTKKEHKKPQTANNRFMGKSAAELDHELQYAKENLQATIEELETSNEELKSSNEELQSNNEELQSVNEEMETSKEELQSLNEESITVNAELQSRIGELSQINNDMKNLLDSTDIATLFLDIDLCVRRYTPKTTDIISLTASDVGRPIKHFSTSLINTDLSEYGKLVLEDLLVRDIELKSMDGKYYSMKVRPYRTINNVIDGVVITFTDITESKHIEQALRESDTRFRTLFEQTNDSVVLIDAENLHFTEFNQLAFERLGYKREEFEKLSLADIQSKTSELNVQEYVKINKQGSGSFQAQHKHKNGKIGDVLVKTKAISIADKKYLLSTWTDIHPQKEVKKQP